MAGPLSPAERKTIQEGVRGGGSSCPRCKIPLRTTMIPPRQDVAYVRNRVLIECDRCGLKEALDLR